MKRRALGILSIALASCSPEPPAGASIGVAEVSVPATVQARRGHLITGIQHPVDAAFAQGAVYVLSGGDRARVFRVDLLADAPTVEELPLPDSSGRALAMEAWDGELLLLGDWGRHLLVVDLADGTVTRRAGYTPTDRLAVTSTGAVLTPDPHQFIGYALRRTEPAPLRRRDYSRPFGYLPIIDDRPTVRLTWDAAGVREVFVAVTYGDTVHVLGDREGVMVTFDPNGRAVRVGSLYAPALGRGAASANAGYGRARRPIANSFAATCSGDLIVSVGRDMVHAFRLDPSTYRGRQVISAPVESLGGRRIALCGRHLVAFSPDVRGMMVWDLGGPESLPTDTARE